MLNLNLICLSADNEMHVVCFAADSAQHKDMVQTFWHTNHIRNPRMSVSISSDSTQRLTSDIQRVSCSILHDYEADMKRRYRNGGAPADWKDCLELQKSGFKKLMLKSSLDESSNGSSPKEDESLKLEASKMPSSTASSCSTLQWRMDVFLLFSDDYQRYICLFLTLS